MQLITLANKDTSSLIHDIIIRPLKVNKDETGILVETMRKDWQDVYGEGREFAMQYYSVTKSGIARDEDLWHYHPGGQQDRFLVLKGEIVVAIGDNRESSPTKGTVNLFHMESQKEPYMIVVPERTLHGFMVVSEEDAILINFPTRLYDPKQEGRIPYAEAAMTTEDGVPFAWDRVRALFPHLQKNT